jgi:hypothetical protein
MRRRRRRRETQRRANVIWGRPEGTTRLHDVDHFRAYFVERALSDIPSRLACAVRRPSWSLFEDACCCYISYKEILLDIPHNCGRIIFWRSRRWDVWSTVAYLCSFSSMSISHGCSYSSNYGPAPPARLTMLLNLDKDAQTTARTVVRYGSLLSWAM